MLRTDRLDQVAVGLTTSCYTTCPRTFAVWRSRSRHCTSRLSASRNKRLQHHTNSLLPRANPQISCTSHSTGTAAPLISFARMAPSA